MNNTAASRLKFTVGARRIIGFDRKIALSWLDATADWAAAEVGPAARTSTTA